MVAYWVVGVPLGYWLAFPMGLGLEGFWWGLVAALGVIALVLARIFLRGDWVARIPEARA
jgi:MATE family multidrug resistance protein